jgi:hypothetical protein
VRGHASRWKLSVHEQCSGMVGNHESYRSAPETCTIVIWRKREDVLTTVPRHCLIGAGLTPNEQQIPEINENIEGVDVEIVIWNGSA